jgi:hypothetical protein
MKETDFFHDKGSFGNKKLHFPTSETPNLPDFSLNKTQNQKSFGKWLTKCAKFKKNF